MWKEVRLDIWKELINPFSRLEQGAYSRCKAKLKSDVIGFLLQKYHFGCLWGMDFKMERGNREHS